MWPFKENTIALVLEPPEPVIDLVEETRTAMTAANAEFGAAAEARRQFKNEHGIETDYWGCITHILRIDSQKRGEWVRREWARLQGDVGRKAIRFYATQTAWSEAVKAAKENAA